MHGPILGNREGEYKDGKKHGRWVLYYPSGVVKSEATFHEGVYTGYYCSYHKNGEKFREGRYREIRGDSGDGRKEGEWFQYREDGSLDTKTVYSRGRVVERIRYHEFPEGR